jgi:hypothetical protein
MIAILTVIVFKIVIKRKSTRFWLLFDAYYACVTHSIEQIVVLCLSLVITATKVWVKLINVCVHWQRFFGKNVGDSCRLFAWLGHVGWHDTDRILSTCGVALPKVAKASTNVCRDMLVIPKCKQKMTSLRGQASWAKMMSLGGKLTALVCLADQICKQSWVTNISLYKHFFLQTFFSTNIGKYNSNYHVSLSLSLSH